MLDDELKSLLQTMQQENAAAHVETRRHADERASEIRRHFDVTTEHHDTKIDALAELITLVDQKLTRRTDDLEQRMERGFAETQAMI